ncbi:right-handed parallel beta-helix repeat-containing protein [Flavimarina sp. Hel_I_48]|uniref:right-handed parallel beta-helix repeat-containing protein n=1 Tax=Flavimarina sp. Hel_I_48 TaxID=1392488 RepID=UPI0004DF6E6A|nr:right-handed parallel beta-helix repeat-containing protein [Flavimarina sp. Hel_I_48]
MSNFKYYFILTLSSLFLASCAEESIVDLTNEELNAITAELHEKKSGTVQNCDFELSNIKEGTEKAINCIIDLDGKTIQLKKNVTLTYDGGDIVNGVLVFDNGKIDGQLLNKDLEIEGSADLIQPVFNFEADRWDLTQGRTTFRNALHNRIRLEELMKIVKGMGAHTFKIDEFDAYFEITEVTHPTNPNFYPSVEAINVPGDFTLEMTDNTHLRTFPNSSKKTSLLAIRNVSNATIKGGVLHGDRDEHEYVGYGSHEWGHLLDLHSATFAVVDGVKMINATGDGLVVHSLGFAFKSNYIPAHDIVIKNCVFDSSRRNNLAITDGYNIIVEDSEFYRSGVDTPKSKGTNPKFAIDIEAYRKRENGKIVPYEKIKNVILRNNIEREGARGGFLIAVGDNITIENNDVEDGIGYKYTNNSIIRNNRMVARKESELAMGLGMRDSRTISNNTVTGNYIEGFNVAMSIYGDDHMVSNNTIKNCGTGISGKDFSNTKIINNTITSTDPKSRGIFIHYTSVNRVLFKNNTIDVVNNPFRFDLINLKEGQEKFCTHLVDNEFNSSYHGLISNSNGVSLMKNTVNTGIQIWDSKNSIIEDNFISSENRDGIYLINENKDIALLNNAIAVPSNKQCIRVQESTKWEDIEEQNNECL